MRMHNPPHPGEIIKTLCLKPLGVTVTQAADALGVSRKTLSAILNGRARISPEMAVRLSMAFGTSSESWLNQQMQYDLWHAEQRRKRLRVAKLVPEHRRAANAFFMELHQCSSTLTRRHSSSRTPRVAGSPRS